MVRDEQKVRELIQSKAKLYRSDAVFMLTVLAEKSDEIFGIDPLVEDIEPPTIAIAMSTVELAKGIRDRIDQGYTGSDKEELIDSSNNIANDFIYKTITRHQKAMEAACDPPTDAEAIARNLSKLAELMIPMCHQGYQFTEEDWTRVLAAISEVRCDQELEDPQKVIATAGKRLLEYLDYANESGSKSLSKENIRKILTIITKYLEADKKLGK